MNVAHIGNAKESICGNEVAGFNSGRLEGDMLKVGRNFKGRNGRNLLRLRVLLRDLDGSYETVRLSNLCQLSVEIPFQSIKSKTHHVIDGLFPLLLLAML